MKLTLAWMALFIGLAGAVASQESSAAHRALSFASEHGARASGLWLAHPGGSAQPEVSVPPFPGVGSLAPQLALSSSQFSMDSSVVVELGTEVTASVSAPWASRSLLLWSTELADLGELGRHPRVLEATGLQLAFEAAWGSIDPGPLTGDGSSAFTLLLPEGALPSGTVVYLQALAFLPGALPKASNLAVMVLVESQAGGFGGDMLAGSGGDDVTLCPPDDMEPVGKNRIIGTAAADGLVGTPLADLIRGRAGIDSIRGFEGPDCLYGGPDQDFIRGDSGRDSIFGGAGGDDCRGDTGDDKIFGGEENDTLVGDSGNDMLMGEAGFDILDGGPGFDILMGGDDTDMLLGGPDDDNLFGGEGNDDLDGGAGFDAIFGGDGDDNIRGGEGEDLLVGGDGADDLDGSTGCDVLKGGPGPDDLLGREDDDSLQGDGGDDELRGGAGNDCLDGGSGDDELLGGDDTDELEGGFGRDQLCGENGDDMLNGEEDGDTLDGGAGSDCFIIDDASDSTPGDPDLIVDFEQGIDIVKLGSGIGTAVQAGAPGGTTLGYVFSLGHTELTDAGGTFRLRFLGNIALANSDFDFDH